MGKAQKEKPLAYYAKYLGGHKRFPKEDNIAVYIHPTLLELAFKSHSIKIPYSDINDIENIDKGKVFDGARIAALGMIGLLAKRKINATVIQCKDEYDTHDIALDFLSNAQHAQPIIYDRMMQARKVQKLTHTQQEEPTLIQKEHSGGPFN